MERSSRRAISSDLNILFSKARAARLDKTFFAVELLIWLALILNIVLKLESVDIPRWREVASMGVYHILR